MSVCALNDPHLIPDVVLVYPTKLTTTKN